MKPIKGSSLKQSHTSSAKIGSGDYYGQGKKNPQGKLRSGFVIGKPSKINTKNPPKSLG